MFSATKLVDSGVGIYTAANIGSSKAGCSACFLSFSILILA